MKREVCCLVSNSKQCVQLVLCLLPFASLLDQAPLSVTYIAKNACYIAIQTTAAATLTVLQLAAHQAVFSVWVFASFLICEVLDITRSEKYGLGTWGGMMHTVVYLTWKCTYAT